MSPQDRYFRHAWAELYQQSRYEANLKELAAWYVERGQRDRMWACVPVGTEMLPLTISRIEPYVAAFALRPVSIEASMEPMEA